MNFEAIRGLVQLVRPLNVLFMMVVTAAAVILAGATMGNLREVLLAALAAGLVGGAANAINDYFDVEIDRVNRPRRPLPRGAVSRHAARLLWFILSVAGISLNLFLNSVALGIAAGSVVMLFAYSAVLKRTVLIGNIVVGAMTGMAFVYGASVMDAVEKAVFPALFAGLINLGREILKDVEDMEGDRRENANTLPIKYGVRSALRVATFVFLLLMAATLVPYQLGMYGSTYLAIVVLVHVVLCYVMVAMWTDASKAGMTRISASLKVAMLIGLAAVVAGEMTA